MGQGERSAEYEGNLAGLLNALDKTIERLLPYAGIRQRLPTVEIDSV